MLRQRFIKYSIYATIIAILITACVDCRIGAEGGASYLFHLIGRSGSAPHLLSGLRDELIGNIVFFAIVGFATAYATTRDAKEEGFVQRLQSMFPLLDRNADLIKPILSLVKEDASITRDAVLQLHLLAYDPAAKAYKVGVNKQETMVSLLQNEAYEDEDFMLSVDSDVVPGYDRLGDVKEAKLIPIAIPTTNGGVDPARSSRTQASPIDFLNHVFPELTSSNPKWSVEDARITIAPGHDAQLTLRYEIMSIVGIPFSSVIRRPARSIRVEVYSSIGSSGSNTPGPAIQASIVLKGEGKPQVCTFQASDSSHPVFVVNFAPNRRRPRVDVLFSAPDDSVVDQ